MITSLNFIHLRSTVSLARRMRRMARKIHKVIPEILKDEKDISEDYNKGDAKGEMEAYSDLFDDEKKAEELLKAIIKEFLIFERGEEKEEHHEEDELRKVISKLSDSDKSKLNKSVEISNQIHQQLEHFFHQSKIEFKDLFLDRDHIMKYKTIFNDEKMSYFIKRMSRLARKDIKEEQKMERKLDKAFSELIKATKKDQTTIDRSIDTINNYMRELEEDLLHENEHLGKEIYYVTVLYIHLVHRIRDEQPDMVAELKKTGYPEEFFKTIEAGQMDAQNFMHEALQHLYRMARYVEHQENNNNTMHKAKVVKPDFTNNVRKAA